MIVRLNKTDVARRQIDASIRLFFSAEEPIAVHSVIAAGLTIVKDLCRHRGDIDSFNGWVLPDAEKKLWRTINESANFFKHADKDPNEIHEFNPEWTEDLILTAAKWFRDLGNSASPEMDAYLTWYSLSHPGFVNEKVLSAFRNAGVSKKYEALRENFEQLDLRQKLNAGLRLIQLGRGFERSPISS
jgi:hypothetical protein